LDSTLNVIQKIKKRRKSIIFILLMAIALFGLFVTTLVDPNNDKHIPSGSVIYGDLPSMSKQEILDMLKKKQDASKFTIQVNSEATFKSGSSTLSLLAANPAVNSVDCYLEILNGDQLLYTSPYLKPRQYIKTAKLSVTPKNKEKLIVRYNLVFNGQNVGVVEAEINVREV
jgi:hypothetical protein